MTEATYSRLVLRGVFLLLLGACMVLAYLIGSGAA
jgi:hypothetical protein